MKSHSKSSLPLRCFIAMHLFYAVAPDRTVAQLTDPLNDPIPTLITKSGLTVEMVNFVQLPDTRGTIGEKPDRIRTTTRINFFRQAPDGRFFVNDLRGQFYVLDEDNEPQMYVDLDIEGNSLFPDMNFDRGLASGFTTFQFHPEFASNGLFYTIHSERPSVQSPAATFTSPDNAETGKGVNFHTVLTEWQAADPAADEFLGSRREMARFASTTNSYFHPFGDINFHPLAQPGDDDYGLMYISGGDWGYINGVNSNSPDVDGKPAQLQRLDTLAGTMIRIDPRSPSVTGGPTGQGDYTIPTGNPYFEDADEDGVDDSPGTFGEIWAHGFRNGHRMAWDEEGRLLVSQIGERNIESTMFVEAADNHGWPRREGTFVNGVNAFYDEPDDLDFGADGELDSVYHLPPRIGAGFVDDGLDYPVLQFDHDDGVSHAGGFVYNGDAVPQLRGKFVFGTIVDGRVFYANYDEMLAADDGVPQTTAEIFELQLLQDDAPVNLNDIVAGRVDLRFGMDDDGELYLLTKGDGFIRKLVGTPLPGDFDGNNLVDGFDFLAWQRGESPDPLSADDLATWEANFNDPAAQSDAATVPEPSTLMYAAVMMLTTCGVQRSSLGQTNRTG